ncbi:hypothetical protein ACTOV4_00465 [Brucella sp. C7-11G]
MAKTLKISGYTRRATLEAELAAQRKEEMTQAVWTGILVRDVAFALAADFSGEVRHG